MMDPAGMTDELDARIGQATPLSDRLPAAPADEPVRAAPRDPGAGSSSRRRSLLLWYLRRGKGMIRDMVPALIAVASFILLGVVAETSGWAQVLPPDGPSFLDPASRVFAWTLVIGIGGLLADRTLAVIRRARGGSELIPPRRAALRFLLRRSARALAAGSFVGLVSFLMPFFLGFKRAIPQVQDFGPWDLRLTALERILHFGTEPWRILHPLLGTPAITVFLDDLYYIWFPFSVTGAAVLTWLLHREARVRFQLSFVCVWIVLGILVATAFASVGPVYFGRIVGEPDPYRELMAYLAGVNAEHPLRALEVQDRLWEAYIHGFTGLTSGIAALPSLHVAIPILYALALGTRYPRAAFVVWVYAGLIFLGSIHLGWHYAVDGYASLVLVLLVWKGAGRVSEAWERRRIARSGRRSVGPARGNGGQPPA